MAAALCFFALGRESYFLDEAASLSFVNLDWGDYWHLIATREANQSLFYTLLRGWSVLGEGEFVVRSLSALFATVSIPLVYALGKRLFSARVGMIAAVLLALNALFVRVGQQARGYSLVILLVIASTYLFVLVNERRSTAVTAAYVIVAGLSVYAHAYAVFVILAHFIAAVVRGRSSWSPRLLLSVYGLVAALVLPMTVFIATRDSGQISWIDEPTAGTLPVLLALLSGGRRPIVGALLAALYAALCCVALLPPPRGSRFLSLREREPWRVTLLGGWLLLPTVGAFLVSFLKPALEFRYASVALPALALAGAAGLERIKAAFTRSLLLAVIVVLAGWELALQYGEPNNEDWRAATRSIVGQSQSGDQIAFVPPYARLPFGLYVKRFGAASIAPQPATRDFSWLAADLRDDVASGRLAVYPRPRDRALASVGTSADRVWAVFSFADRPARDALERSIEDDYARARTLRFTDVEVVLYERDE